MIRQAALAVGVAMFVAIIGSPTSLERLAAFHRGWWIMAAIAALDAIPNYIFIKARKSTSSPSPGGGGSTRME